LGYDSGGGVKMLKEECIKLIGKEKEYLFDEYMARTIEPEIIGNEVHYPLEAFNKFCNIHKINWCEK
jgi:hypothetical protein